METIAFGDWHGNDLAALHAIEVAHYEFPNIKKYIHVGDFGFWDTRIFTNSFLRKVDESFANNESFPTIEDEDMRGYVAAVNRTLKKHDIILYVCLGNHENYWELDETFGYWGAYVEQPVEYDSVTADNYTRPPTVKQKTYKGDSGRLYCTGMDKTLLQKNAKLDEDGFIMSDLFSNIRIIPRAHIWKWGDIQYASLGGANSIDVAYRTRGISWWEQESILPEETDSLIELCQGKDIDVLITHDGPIDVVNKLYGHGSKIDRKTTEWGGRSGQQVQKAIRKISPKVNVCGHHHVRKTDYTENTRVEILDRDGSSIRGNRLIINKDRIQD